MTKLILRFYKKVNCLAQCVMGKVEHWPTRINNPISSHSTSSEILFTQVPHSSHLLASFLQWFFLPWFVNLWTPAPHLLKVFFHSPHRHYPKYGLLFTEKILKNEIYYQNLSSAPLVYSFVAQLQAFHGKEGTSTTISISDPLIKPNG